MDDDGLDWDSWWERLRLGIPEMDKQHHWLIHTIRTFDPDAPKMRRKEVLMELLRYTREHFQFEEDLMKKSNYPGRERHRKAHDRILNDLLEFTEGSLTKPGTMSEFHAFVKSWIFEHLLAMDTLLAAHLRAGREAQAMPDQLFPSDA